MGLYHVANAKRASSSPWMLVAVTFDPISLTSTFKYNGVLRKAMDVAVEDFCQGMPDLSRRLLRLQQDDYKYPEF